MVELIYNKQTEKGLIGLLFRNCAGGIVFYQGRVLLLKNEKDEWVMPKGVIRDGHDARTVALARVRDEAGVPARIVMNAGDTCYEFFSVTRRQPVCNRIQWFVMEGERGDCIPAAPFTQAAFFDKETALDHITYTQDRSLLAVAWDKYDEIHDEINKEM